MFGFLFSLLSFVLFFSFFFSFSFFLCLHFLPILDTRVVKSDVSHVDVKKIHIVSCETCVAQNVVVHMGSMNTRNVSMGEEMHKVSSSEVVWFSC